MTEPTGGGARPSAVPNARPFGSPGGPDPVACGRLGGKAKAKGSLTSAVRAYAEANPSDVTQVARALFGVAGAGKAGSVEAAKVLLDRLDGPISLGVDAFVGLDRTIILRVGPTGAPLPGYEHPPELPPGLDDMASPEALSREAFDSAREAEICSGDAPEVQETRTQPRMADITVPQPVTPTEPEPLPELLPDPSIGKPEGWRPTKAEREAMEDARVRKALGYD